MSTADLDLFILNSCLFSFKLFSAFRNDPFRLQCIVYWPISGLNFIKLHKVKPFTTGLTGMHCICFVQGFLHMNYELRIHMNFLLHCSSWFTKWHFPIYWLMVNTYILLRQSNEKKKHNKILLSAELLLFFPNSITTLP